MSILIDERTKAVIQGVTGREAQLRVQLMKEYGTVIVAGVTPGKGGQKVLGLPVYDTVQEAVEAHPEINASGIFVPASFARSAAWEAIDAGIKVITLHPERVPQQDMMEILAYARGKGVILIGPNTPGVVSPGKALLGLIGGRLDMARIMFKPGPVGVMSRSGGATTTVAYYLSRRGIGQTTVVGMGGDALVGTRWADLLRLFETDPDTKAVVGFGEIGTDMEEEAARLIKEGGFTKPLVAYISGRYATSGVRFGHAGAIISRGMGATRGKIEALREAGAVVVDHLADIGEAAANALARY